jgi:ankyrin repeat protein
MVGFAFGLVVLTLRSIGSGLDAWEYSKLGPLHQAACNGNVAECERLVKGGRPVDATDDDGVTALSWAVFYGKTDVVRKLIELSADVNHVDKRASSPFTPLMYTATTLRGRSLNGTQAQRNEIARLLIQHGADVNHAMGDGHTSGSGQTTLHFAAQDKNAALVRMLLAAGANRNVKEIPHGWTPLDVAKFPDYAPNDEVIAALQQPAQ